MINSSVNAIGFNIHNIGNDFRSECMLVINVAVAVDECCIACSCQTVVTQRIVWINIDTFYSEDPFFSCGYTFFKNKIQINIVISYSAVGFKEQVSVIKIIKTIIL